jgi:MSHA pilin protein MshD
MSTNKVLIIKNKQTGVTLIELVISIVILSIAVVGVLSALGTIGGRSADPMIREQSIAIADAYLEEINLSRFAAVAGCPAVPGAGGRANFSHVCHYNGLADSGAVNQNGDAIAGLSSYSVAVAVSNSGALGGLASSVVLRVDVTVTGPTSEAFSLSAYRTNY